MRQIKFRWWDTQMKCFIDLGAGHDNRKVNSFLNDSVLVAQQFTGVLDKNGKEVYEGDIIEGKSEMVNLISGRKTGKTRDFYKKIIWSDKWNGWSTFDLGRQKENAIGGINIALKFYPVIGNVFENSKLLNNK